MHEGRLWPGAVPSPLSSRTRCSSMPPWSREHGREWRRRDRGPQARSHPTPVGRHNHRGRPTAGSGLHFMGDGYGASSSGVPQARWAVTSDRGRRAANAIDLTPRETCTTEILCSPVTPSSDLRSSTAALAVTPTVIPWHARGPTQDERHSQACSNFRCTGRRTPA